MYRDFTPDLNSNTICRIFGLDRFSQGLPDPQENLAVVAVCGACGEDIVKGGDIYVLPDGNVCHADEVCLVALTQTVYGVAEAVEGEW